ncbi:hypothetical protein BC628DRAFT_924339 [Trametes gibbosa]|nr:hypothetical protein BC628DRAFT_924339 [Trametes gibbosa]
MPLDLQKLDPPLPRLRDPRPHSALHAHAGPTVPRPRTRPGLRTGPPPIQSRLRARAAQAGLPALSHPPPHTRHCAGRVKLLGQLGRHHFDSVHVLTGSPSRRSFRSALGLRKSTGEVWSPDCAGEGLLKAYAWAYKAWKEREGECRHSSAIDRDLAKGTEVRHNFARRRWRRLRVKWPAVRAWMRRPADGDF